jgi:hypothetical protein
MEGPRKRAVKEDKKEEEYSNYSINLFIPCAFLGY